MKQRNRSSVVKLISNRFIVEQDYRTFQTIPNSKITYHGMGKSRENLGKIEYNTNLMLDHKEAVGGGNVL